MSNESQYLLPLCEGIARKNSKELTSYEVEQLLGKQLLPSVIRHLWGFTGYFYRWPETLLKRPDVPDEMQHVLEINLADELGLNGTLPHRLLFSNMAHSLGVALDPDEPPNAFMRVILHQAQSLSFAEALGQFFANEITSKWAGFIEILQDNSACDMAFFNVHCDEQHHSHILLDDIRNETMLDFLRGVINFSKIRAAYMDEIRVLINPFETQQAVIENPSAIALKAFKRMAE